jgi:hypothetical protein
MSPPRISSKEWALDLRETFRGPRGQFNIFGGALTLLAGDQVRIGHSAA